MVVAIGAWLTLRGDDGDDDGLDAVRALPAVTSASREAYDIVVTLRAGTDRAGVATVLRALPDDADGGILRLGRADLEFEDRGASAEDATGPFLAAAGVRAPGGRIVLARRSAGWSVEAEVPRIAQAAPLAREVVARIAPQGRYLDGFGRLEVSLADAPQADFPPVALRLLAQADRHVMIAALDAAVALPGRAPEVSTNGSTGELRVRADGVADAGKAWDDATRALRLDGADRRDVSLYVDDPAAAGDDVGRGPVLSGPADASPDRALALLRALDGSAIHAFASTDLKVVEADVRGPGAARSAATATRAAGARSMTVRWPVPGPDTPTAGSTTGERPRTRIADAPATVLRLLPGVARARQAGILQLEWDRPPAIDTPELRIAPPRWIDLDTALVDAPDRLRRLTRAVRAVGWPGAARLGLPLGPSGCKDYPKGAATARITSTADGRARSVEAQATCEIDGTLRTVRRAWDAGAG